MPNAGKSDSKARIQGQEEYLTQVVGSVLAEDPVLATEVVRSWGEATVLEAISVRTEVPYVAPPGFEAKAVQVDLVLESPEFLMFIENKVGAALNQYPTVAMDLDPVDQVTLYHAVLERERGTRAARLLVLCRDPQSGHEGLPLYRGHRFWWELYALVRERLKGPPPPHGHVAWLASEMMRFFEEVQLDPPAPLRQGHEFRSTDGLRVLAHAARRARGIESPRMGTGLRYRYDGSEWTVGFQGDQLSVFEACVIGCSGRFMHHCRKETRDAPDIAHTGFFRFGRFLVASREKGAAERSTAPPSDTPARCQDPSPGTK